MVWSPILLTSLKIKPPPKISLLSIESRLLT